jgi:hypothetical protein
MDRESIGEVEEKNHLGEKRCGGLEETFLWCEQGRTCLPEKKKKMGELMEQSGLGVGDTV